MDDTEGERLEEAEGEGCGEREAEGERVGVALGLEEELV